MPLEFIDLNPPPVVAVNCLNRKAMGKEKMMQNKVLYIAGETELSEE